MDVGDDEINTINRLPLDQERKSLAKDVILKSEIMSKQVSYRDN